METLASLALPASPPEPDHLEWFFLGRFWMVRAFLGRVMNLGVEDRYCFRLEPDWFVDLEHCLLALDFFAYSVGLEPSALGHCSLGLWFSCSGHLPDQILIAFLMGNACAVVRTFNSTIIWQRLLI